MTKNSKNSLYEAGYGFSNGIMKVLKSGKEFYIFCTSNCLTPGKYWDSKFLNPTLSVLEISNEANQII